MKKYIFLFILSILFPLAARSQYGWIQQQTNTDNDINGIAFSTPLNGFAVGTYGTVLKTTDGGANWNLNSVGNINIQNVVFPGSDTALFVGYPGECYKSTNNGASWFSVFISYSDVYTYSYFLNQNTGWITAYNGRIYKTTNGGYNWDYEIGNTGIVCIALMRSDAAPGSPALASSIT